MSNNATAMSIAVSIEDESVQDSEPANRKHQCQKEQHQPTKVERKANTNMTTLSAEFKSVTSLDSMLNLYRALSEENERAFATNSFSTEKDFCDIELSKSAQVMMECENAGGSSERSEAMSFEMLRQMFGAELVKTEMDIQYDWASKKTDYSATIHDHVFGVSVTRAMKYRGRFTEEDAYTLLKKKLHGVNVSSEAVTETDKWSKQLLHVFATHDYVCNILEKVYNKMSEELKSNTIVLVTVVKSGGQWLFDNRLP